MTFLQEAIMPSKPVRSYGNVLKEVRELLKSVEGPIEVATYQYAQEIYGNDFLLERFTELAWNIHRRPSFWNRQRPILLSVQLANTCDPAGYPKSKGFFIGVEFLDLHYSESDAYKRSYERAKQFCMELSRQTRLTVRSLGGGWFYWE